MDDKPNTPPVTPPVTPPAAPTEEEKQTEFNKRLSAFFSSDDGKKLFQQSGQKQESGESVADAVNRILAERESRSKGEQRITTLESAIETLTGHITELSKKRKKFSLFDFS